MTVQSLIPILIIRKVMKMNIAFWSSVSGKSATSGNMLAVSTMTSLLYSLKVVLLQFDYCSKSIDSVLEGKKDDIILNDTFSYYNQRGIDDLFDKIKLDGIKEEDIANNLVNVKDTSMFYIPTSKHISLGAEERETGKNVEILMESLSGVGDINFIDNINGNKYVSRKILRTADVIVYNVHQGLEEISYITENEKLLKKTVFLVGRYDGDSRENIASIRKKYGIKKSQIAVIPYNIGYHDSIQEGKVVSFISKNIYSKRTDTNFDFINNLFNATNMILKKAGYNEAY